MPTPSAEMLTKLRPLLTSLRKDLVERAKAPAVAAVMHGAHEKTRQEQRTADPFEVWMDDRCAQVAAAWVLSCIFVRTLEDRELLERRRIAGAGAEDSEEQFLALAPFLTARDYLLTVFKELSRFPGVKQVFDARHNPVWILGPSAPMASELLKFFRQKDAQGALALTFSSEDTRLLGDLYQDLYEDVRAKYALLQTPDFIEEFILDETLEPAIRSFGLRVVKLIDPTCGSGHFLLGAYNRLFRKWCDAAPSERPEINALRALEQVAGADINPYAVAIARFRLALTFLSAAGIQKLAAAPDLRTNLCVADSLLYGLQEDTLDLALRARPEGRAEWQNPLFLLEDAEEAERILGARYHAVVGNPPYIVVSDKALRSCYKDKYVACHRDYQLVAPFIERFFGLGAEGGFIGTIVGNGFMKREFGSKLVENVLRHVDLTHIVDSSLAFIPGHGTPTVMIFGRRSHRTEAAVTAVLAVRGENPQPVVAADGKVWRSIKQHHLEDGFQDEFVSVVSLDRARFDEHPWVLTGGAAAHLKEQMESRASQRLRGLSVTIGRVAHTGNDDAYVADFAALERRRIPSEQITVFVEGQALRDWSLTQPTSALFPYDKSLSPKLERNSPSEKWLWPYRSILWQRREPNGTHKEIGLTWYEYSRFHPERYSGRSIAYAEVATHNHFVLNDEPKVFKQTAPAIKLNQEAGDNEYYALLAYLNSSTACFWIKQVCFPKATSSEARPEKGIPEDNRFAFSSTAVRELPVPSYGLLAPLVPFAKRMEVLARERLGATPVAALQRALEEHVPLEAACDLAEGEEQRVLAKMIALQEEIDWKVYDIFGFSPDTTADLHAAPVGLAVLPFRWTSPTDANLVPSQIKERFAARYKRLQGNDFLRLLESPVHKRLWQGSRGVFAHKVATYAEKFVQATKDWLLRQVERRVFADAPRPVAQSATEILGVLQGHQHCRAVIDFISSAGAVGPDSVVSGVLESGSVPYASAFRYTEPGLGKRAAWERCWETQRAADARAEDDAQVGCLPPKYSADDFQEYRYWSLRGSLDLPKEALVSYPKAGPEGRTLYGWAGWDDLQQATALAGLYQRRKTEDGWGGDRLTPFLAGLLELVPWLKQWHNEPNADFGGQRLGDFYSAFVESESRNLNLTLDALRAWRPEPGANGRRTATSRSAKEKATVTPDAVLASVDALAGETGVDSGALADAVGAPKATVAKVADALVEQGLLQLTSKRPKRYSRVSVPNGASS